MFSGKYIFYQARLSKTLIWPFKSWKRWRDKAIPTIYQSHCICWNILVSTISEMDDGRWKSVAHLRRVTFTALVMDESYFFVSSNPPLLSCKSCSGHQPYFFSSLLKLSDTSILPGIDCCRNYSTSLKTIFFYVLCNLCLMPLLAEFKDRLSLKI